MNSKNQKGGSTADEETGRQFLVQKKKLREKTYNHRENGRAEKRKEIKA